MRRDSIFYKLFQQYPALLFTLVKNPPENASEYTFDSKAVKEPRFEIDGVFVPPENQNPGTIYFCEVQFQRDEMLYERVFAESYLYFYRCLGNLLMGETPKTAISAIVKNIAIYK